MHLCLIFNLGYINASSNDHYRAVRLMGGLESKGQRGKRRHEQVGTPHGSLFVEPNIAAHPRRSIALFDIATL